MPAIVTDKFRIMNADNFVSSVLDTTNNAYYTFLGLANPYTPSDAFGRDNETRWNTQTTTPSPIDNFDYTSHYKQTSLFGKKITSENIRKVVKKHTWTANVRYDMYRHDYSSNFETPNSKTSRLYDSNYYVVNKDFNVYVCLDNGSFGLPGTEDSKGNRSQDEPTFTDLDPSPAGTSGDGYVWKYLFTISPSDIIKFDSTEYIVIPNNWSTTNDINIKNVRDAADSDVNLNQIKKVYIEKKGSAYREGNHVLDILGDGTGAKVLVSVNASKEIYDTKIVSGGSGYTYGIVDLTPCRDLTAAEKAAKLIPIIPPSKGHGYDIYNELGADKVMIYTRFDTLDRDFPVETSFAQIGILKNPKSFGSNTLYNSSTFSSLYAIKFSTATGGTSLTPGVEITQTVVIDGISYTAKGYVASYDSDTKVLKYFRDRSLYYNDKKTPVDYSTVSTGSKHVNFQSNASNAISGGPFSGTVDVSFGDPTPLDVSDNISLGVYFTKGLANPEINTKTGDLIYITNRKIVSRDSRQKEDVKIILEF